MKNNSFKKNDYFIVKNLLNSNEVDNYRKKLSKINSLNTTWDLPYGITKNKDLWSLIVNKNLLKNLKKEVGDIKYTQHSINHVNYYRKSRKDLGYLQFFDEDLINILKENKLFLK